MPKTSRRQQVSIGMASLTLLLVAGGCQSDVRVGPEAVAGKVPDATVRMNEVQAAYIGSGSAGNGTLYYRGRSYPFIITGAGIGGIGASTIDAHGEVYNLRDLVRFPGAYGEARYGFALGTESAGDLWLQNESGVIMHLKARREGLMLSLGGDAMAISMK
ncbi:hypothetical protein [Paracraurococcus lichenis]|uniref:DUF1134 domain-containing protein n=1 Tax=Paracraurococcus lichenis TaxID=3064888 RepID=A0ABT9ECI8_9PROT|nr:hypothetical protein [Paracraurococcus sp. LOR1-02]MDO9713819.1 hypothetical protein [Paracraurococcus sp. LOR1-02]